MFTEYRKIQIVVLGKLGINIYIYIQTAMLGTREYTLCSPFRANAHNSSFHCIRSEIIPNSGEGFMKQISFTKSAAGMVYVFWLHCGIVITYALH